MDKKTLLFIILFVILWNSGYIVAEYALRYSEPMTLLFWRYLFLTALIYLYVQITGKFVWPGLKKTAPHMLIGVLSHAVWLSCVLLSLKYDVPAGIVALIIALQPLATGLFSGAAAGEPTSGKKWAGLLAGFAGVTLAIIFRIDISDSSSVFWYLLPLGSVAAITVATLFRRRMEVKGDDRILPPDIELFYQSAATAVVLFFPAFLWEGMAAEWSSEFIYSILWLVVAVSGGAYLLMWLLIERMDAAKVASLFYLGPPVTMLMAWAAFGDTLRLTDILGLAIIFAGVVITNLSGRKKEP